MQPIAATAGVPTAEALWKWGRLALAGSLGFGLAIVLLVAWSGSALMALVLPAVIPAAAAAFFLFRRPTLNLVVVLVGFVVVADNQAGFQLREIAYGLYLYAVLLHWYAVRAAIRREPFLHSAEDRALFVFLLLLPCTLLLTVVYGGSLTGAASEIFSLSLLALYFPLKETIREYRHGPRLLVLTVVCVGALVAARNMLEFSQQLSGATQAWQIATGRVVTNDNLLMVSSVFTLTLVLFARTWLSLGIRMGVFLLCFAGLVMTQSRGYWMAFLLAAGVLFVLADARVRRRMLGFGALGFAALAGIGLLFFGAYLDLLIGGLVERFASVASAVTSDISLVNRFREAQTVMEHVVRNPIVGHGMGVSYYFYDIAHQATDYDALVHNGYVGLWYKFGLWGLGLLLFFWAGVIVRGIQAFRMKAGSPWMRVCGLAAAASLAAFTLSTITSNPFFLKDSLFIFSLSAGLAGGAYRRGLRETGA